MLKCVLLRESYLSRLQVRIWRYAFRVYTPHANYEHPNAVAYVDMHYAYARTMRFMGYLNAAAYAHMHSAYARPMRLVDIRMRPLRCADHDAVRTAAGALRDKRRRRHGRGRCAARGRR